MHNLIQLLPDAIANQIAAGEVVQRPASVVKELMENAIDAGATAIQLIIKDAGKGLIQVIDNGSGMSEVDARMCFERHATSKIRKAEDLFSIYTMGFRGEAMASIASVAQVEMKTKRPDDEVGTSIRIDASVLKSQEVVSCPTGTSIAVKNLFYNIPARRNFLKSNPVEIRHILDEFQRIALANPNIKFSFIQNDEETTSLLPEKLGKRIVDLFGKQYREQLAACEEETSYVSIKGYVGKPQNAKKTRGEQFIFVNNRFIKSTYLNHAVSSAYDRLLPDGCFPFYVLFLTIDPSHIDINVHPTKTEIKFDDDRSVYAIVHAAIRKTLSVNNLIPSLDFDTNTNFLDQIKQVNSGSSTPTNYGFSNNPNANAGKSNSGAWKKLYEGLQDNINDFESQSGSSSTSQDLFKQSSDEPKTIQSKANVYNEYTLPQSGLKLVQIAQKFIGLNRPEGLLLINQKRAYQRILFDQFLENLNRKNGQSQQLIFPETLQLSIGDQLLLGEIINEIKYLGFDIELNDNSNYTLSGVPVNLSEENGQSLIEGILEQIKNESAQFNQLHYEKLARIMANRSAIKFQQKPLSYEEIQQLIEKLFASTNPNVTPNGESISTLINQDQLDALIG